MKRMKRETVIKKNFKDHVATIDQLAQLNCGRVDVEVLTWKKPDTSIYMTKYIISGGTLCVYGDLGEAVYRWYEPVTFEWLSKLDLSYFAGKCCASEVGRDFKEWDEETAIKELKRYAKDGYFDWKKYQASDGPNCLYCREDWLHWLHREGLDVLGDDYYFAAEVGETLNTRCIYHFIGLQMAMKQIARNK